MTKKSKILALGIALLIVLGGLLFAWLGGSSDDDTAMAPAPQPASEPVAAGEVPDAEPAPGSEPAPEPETEAATPEPAGATPVVAGAEPDPAPASDDTISEPAPGTSVAEAGSAATATEDSGAPAAAAQPAAEASGAAAAAEEATTAAMGEETASGEAPAAEPAPEAEPGATAVEEAGEDPATGPEYMRPAFDIVRIGRNGSTVLAGRAEARWRVSILAGEKELGNAWADDRAQWVAVIDTPLESGSQTLHLRAFGPDGQVLDGEAPIVVVVPEREEAEPIVAQLKEDRIELIQAPEAEPSAAASEIAQISLDALSYDELGGVILAGRGEETHLLRIYLDNAVETESRVEFGGTWNTRLRSTLRPKVYTLRVDQIDAAGAVSSRTETPFEFVSTSGVIVEEGQAVIQPGNSLWRVAQHVYGRGTEYLVIFNANKDTIRNPDLIYPGQIFEVPELEEAPATSE